MNKLIIITTIALLGTLVEPAFSSEAVFNIRDFGATGNQSDDATPAVSEAIARCHRAGGGTVYVPAGRYRCLPIVLCDNITLDLAAGAVFLVDLPNPNFKGGSFISAENATNITIKGLGMIDGQARYIWSDYKNDDVEIAPEVEIARRAGVELKRSYRVGNVAHSLYFAGCENLHIEGITLVNSSSWCMRIRASDHVSIHDVTIDSDLKMGVNSDGIDLDGSRNVHIYGCNLSTGDDAICIKTAAKEYVSTNHVDKPTGTSFPAENIVVDNCVLTSSSTAMMIGTETCADIRHVIFSNCVIRNANKGFGINVQDGATVSDVLFANITMDLQRRHWNWWGDAEAFYFVLKKRLPDAPVGTIRDISIENVIAHAQGTSKIIAAAGKPLENISIDNFQLFMDPESTPDKRTANAITVDGATNLTLRDVSIHWNDKNPEPAWKTGLSLANVNRFELDGLAVRQGISGADWPAVLLNNARNGIIKNSRALPGTGSFFQVEGGNTKHLLFLDNVADEARSFITEGEAVNPAEIEQVNNVGQ